MQAITQESSAISLSALEDYFLPSLSPFTSLVITEEVHTILYIAHLYFSLLI